MDGATMGLGRAAARHLPATLVTAGPSRFDLIETLAFDPMDGMPYLEVHLARLKASALALGFEMDRHALRNELHAATFRLAKPSRVRVRLSPSGIVAIETGPIPPAPPVPVSVALVPLPVDPADVRLRHRTSDREPCDAAREAAGTFEVVFVAPDGGLRGGSFTNLFVRRADGLLVTPPAELGLPAGVLRQRLIDAGEAIEGALVPADLAQGFFVGNALRGLIAARLA